MVEQNLEKTSLALDELRQSTQRLRDVIENKKALFLQQKEACQNDANQKNKKIEELKGALEMTIERIDAMAQKIEGVIEQDGSGNNSN